MKRFLFHLILIACLWRSPTTWAAGPILVDTESTGLPVLWYGDFIFYNVESTDEEGNGGTLGKLSNEEATALIDEIFEMWKSVTLASGGEELSIVDLTLTKGSGLGNVDIDNINEHFTYCPSGEFCEGEFPPFNVGSARTGDSPIIFDHDGSITDLIQGVGASDDVLGFAGPRVVQRFDGLLYIVESQAVLNGRFIDCPADVRAGDSCLSPELGVDDFRGIVAHELGHFLGLDHVQVNLSEAQEALNGDFTNVEAVPTMFPIYVGGGGQLTLHYDDKVSIGMLYPATAFRESFCTIRGTVYEADGESALQGVNIIARRVNNSLLESVSFVSGAYYFGAYDNCAAPFGDYELHGIVPGVEYSMEIEKISQAFTGGSSVEPCDPPQTGFDPQTLSGVFSCANGGETITSGSQVSSAIITNKSSTADDPSLLTQSSGGCSLVR